MQWPNRQALRAQRLAIIDAKIADGQRMIDRQQELIAAARARGGDATRAIETLAMFTEICTTMTAYRAAVARRLADG
jgi:hypothetical protein